MSAHTPGPWRWFTQKDRKTGELSQEAWSDPCMRYLVGSNGQGFAHTVGLNGATDEANARLIAAAPELLEALRELVQLEADGCTEYESSIESWERARAAIQRATGSQS